MDMGKKSFAIGADGLLRKAKMPCEVQMNNQQ
jgi:hypothetical protein